ncbi:MAG: MBL fold metallo-hydrolase [Candidatus Taylorbacteria bacterium]|nr:MBL fold metallo-hydrolase [Candidatus Taylorbacteria bacterium]
MESVRKNLQLYFLVFLFGITVLIWYAVFREDRHGILTIAFLDIGQGDAIFVESPSGNQMLIDGGPPSGALLREIGKMMPFYDHSIDMIMVSNPDKDHLGGFVELLNSYEVNFAVEPGTVGASSEARTLEKEIKDKKVKLYIAKRGEKIMLGGGAYFEVLFPDRDVSGVSTNDGSIVGRLVYGNTSIMFTGDSPQNVEQYLVLLDGKNLKSDVLKAGHHGSRTSSSEEFVGFVSPSYAVISDKKGNSYGHPHKETLETFDKFGIKVLRTDQVGTVVMKLDGEKIVLQQ